MHPQNQMVIDFKPAEEPGTRAEFTYHMTPATITITGKGSISVGKDLEAILRKIEYWHQAPVTKFRIIARQGQGTWHAVRWDGKTAIFSRWMKGMKRKPCRRFCFSIRLKRPQTRPRNRGEGEAFCRHDHDSMPKPLYRTAQGRLCDPQRRRERASCRRTDAGCGDREG